MPYVTNISANEVEAIEQLLETDCLISINNTTNAPWNLKFPESDRVLKLFFDDVLFSFQNPKDGLIYNAINHEHVSQAIEFINKWQGKNFIVNCHAGLSRSAAFSLFLHSCYDYDLKPDFWVNSTPNPMILGLLVHSFYRGKV